MYLNFGKIYDLNFKFNVAYYPIVGSNSILRHALKHYCQFWQNLRSFIIPRSPNLQKFLSINRMFNSMGYKNDEQVENESLALIAFITIIAIAVSLLGIIVCMK